MTDFSRQPYRRRLLRRPVGAPKSLTAPFLALLCMPALWIQAGIAAGAAPASQAIKMSPAEVYRNVGVSIALPQEYETQTVSEPFDVLHAVQSDANGKPLHAVTLSAYPLAPKVAADAFADAMMADLQKVLSISKLSVARKSPVEVAGVEAQVRLLTYEYRSQPTAAVKLFFIREEKVAGESEPVRICYVLTAESVADRQATLTGELAEIIKAVKFEPIARPLAVGVTDLGPPIRDHKLGYAIRPPAHWYVRLTVRGLETGATDYILGGVPMPLVRVLAEESPAQQQSPEEAAVLMLEMLRKSSSADGLELKVISQGAAKIGSRDAWQIVASQAPATMPAGRAREQEEPAVVIAQRATGSINEGQSSKRTYWLIAYCQTVDAKAAIAILDKLAGTFEILPPASQAASAAAIATASGPASRPASAPATRESIGRP